MTSDLAPVVAEAVLDLARWHHRLAGYLPARANGVSDIHGTPDHGLKVDHAVIATRSNIALHMRCWVEIGVTDGGFDELPGVGVPAHALWLHQRNDWFCNGQPDTRACDEYVRDTLALRREAERHQQPNMARRITLRDEHGDGYPCPEPDCTGTLVAVMRPADDLLPPVVRCDATDHDNPDNAHAWAADEWLMLGRRIRKQVGA